MRKIILLACLGLAAGCTGDERPAQTRANDAQTLADALNGYEQAGPPTDCVAERDLGSNRSVGESAIIFEGKTSLRLWVNTPPAGCPSLNFGRALILKTPSTRLCRGDIADVVDLSSRIHYGSCGLGDFTPYRKIAQRR